MNKMNQDFGDVDMNDLGEDLDEELKLPLPAPPPVPALLPPTLLKQEVVAPRAKVIEVDQPWAIRKFSILHFQLETTKRNLQGGGGRGRGGEDQGSEDRGWGGVGGSHRRRGCYRGRGGYRGSYKGWGWGGHQGQGPKDIHVHVYYQQ